MLTWVLIFLVVAAVSGSFGFGLIATAAAGIAKIIFYIAAAGLVISLIVHLMRAGNA